jgi:NodT family efflux transporter outer membrane factor (OMF) lipoprotein
MDIQASHAMITMNKLRKVTLPAALSAIWMALLTACTMGPHCVRPAPPAPAQWSARATAPPPTPDLKSASQNPMPLSKATEQSADLSAWWRVFDDPMLSSLIERAASSNLDVRTALLRIDEARAQRAISAAAYWPTMSVDASYSRQRLSETTPTGSLFSSVGNLKVPGGASIRFPNPYNQYQLSANASWEIDLFGRVRRTVEAADAKVQVSVEDQHAVLVSVLADVTQSYLELRGAQARLHIAKDNVTTIDELMELTRQRHAAGLTTDIDVSNASAQATATRAQLPTFELQITQNINQLSRLLGREPDALRSELDKPAQVPSVPPEVSIGLPAQLARRRPDIREAEANLHAATAQIGVAVADLFPRLTLAATGGFQSETAGNLLQWASRFGSLGPALDVPIFDRGRWKAVRLYDVQAQEAALTYQRTVLNALHEVENALAAYGADQQRRRWLDATVLQNQDALTLSRQRYETGLTNFIDVLDAERTLQQNELSLADSTTAVTTDLVGLYRALGGGWQPVQKQGDEPLPPEPVASVNAEF